MKSVVLVALTLMIVGCAGGQKRLYSAPDADLTAYNCVAVAPFKNMSRMGSGGLSMADAVANSLYAAGTVQVVERSEVQRYLRAQGHDPQAVEDTALGVELGRTLRADAVILGTVNDFWYRSVDARPEVSMTLRLIDVQREEVVLVASRTYSPQTLRPGPKLLSAAADFVAADLLQPLATERPSQRNRRVACGYPVPGQLRQADRSSATADGEMPDLIEPGVDEAPSPRLVLSPAVLQVINRLENSERFQIEGLDFVLDELSFRNEGRAQRLLDNLGQALLARPNVRIRIEAHSAGLGDADANRRLTQERAELLSRKLSSEFGISPARIEARGMGGDSPILPNINRRNRETNRRVEIFVLQGP